MNDKAKIKTQGRRLIDMLKRTPMTTLELLMTGISTCPWKRINESLTEHEALKTRKNHKGLNVYYVVNVKKPQTKWVK